MSAKRRPVRIGNCSGAMVDPGDHMLAQASAGPIDVITGDYLAEANIADHAEAFAAGKHPGYAPTALDGLRKSLGVIHQKRIKVIVNGGALNPRGLAHVVHDLAREKGYGLTVAYVEGDNLLPRVGELRLPHLDAENEQVRLAEGAERFLRDPDGKVVAANAYLGCRAIRCGLERGADVVVCGRVADASPVMAAAAWWHGWADGDFEELAGALVAGHLIECSTYSTGANFAGFDGYETGDLLDLACPIAEVDARGGCVITKHEALNGFVTEDVVKCQLLYELQGNIYLNSDVKADLADVAVEQVGKNRVRVSGVKGLAPPPTTKLAVFYKAGFQGELTINATGYATPQKWDLQEAQLRSKLEDWGLTGQIDLLEFQRVGVPQENPRSQLTATSSLRIFVQAPKADTIRQVTRAWAYNFMQHFSGMHCTLDWRQMNPLPFLGYYPALIQQADIEETVNIISQSLSPAADSPVTIRVPIDPPPHTTPMSPRNNYDPIKPRDLSTFGPTRMARLGDISLARSGDKGGNVNIGFFTRSTVGTIDDGNNSDAAADLERWEWLRSFLTRQRLRELMGDDWRSWFHIERVEFPRIRAVHFVVYGLLGRGVSSSARLDSLGKGFAEFLRFVHVAVPVKFLVDSRGTLEQPGKSRAML